MIIFTKIRISIDYMDFILLNVHPASITANVQTFLLMAIS